MHKPVRVVEANLLDEDAPHQLQQHPLEGGELGGVVVPPPHCDVVRPPYAEAGHEDLVEVN